MKDRADKYWNTYVYANFVLPGQLGYSNTFSVLLDQGKSFALCYDSAWLRSL